MIDGRDARATGGLVVEVTDGTTKYNASHYRISVFYDLAKVAVNRLAFSQGHELAPYRATAVAITPGWLRSEMMLEHFGVTEDNWRDALDPNRAEQGQPVAPPDFALSETPRYVGRAIASLAADPERARWNQQSLTSGELAKVYGFKDVDGTSPDVWRKMEESEQVRSEPESRSTRKELGRRVSAERGFAAAHGGKALPFRCYSFNFL
jgi:NAD(P)-dependent dehydrogenase (short-subunit alcohol dehydrogenase family)